MIGIKIVKQMSLALLLMSGLAHQNIHAENIIENGDFSNGYFPWEPPGWWAGGDGTFGVDEQERFCTTVTAIGTANWGAQLRQNGLTYVIGESYQVSLTAWSSTPVTIEMSAVDESDGFVWIFGTQVDIDAPLDGSGQPINLSFVAGADSVVGKFRFLMGGGDVPLNETVCFDDIIVDGPDGTGPGGGLEPPSPVHVSQIGYLPQTAKFAAYALPEEATDFDVARPWSLVQDEAVVASGMTTPFGEGVDAASGDLVHKIDFSSSVIEGENYTLIVTEGDEEHVSEPFAISSAIYSAVKYDALAYFYHNRSGTPILAEVVGDEWARPAGHLSDDEIPTLACLDGEDGCLTRDVSGGWYDAGDHGKYVVNGGISVWTMLNQYERLKHLGSTLDDFSDGSMILPMDEGANGVNDLLDEARWEIEWMLKMQVPSGEPLAGAVYHKMHDLSWTGLPTAPYAEPQPRYIHPPSTAATLNFAAVGAQCYRVYKRVDFRFAITCLTRALRAYRAAKELPIMLANPESVGGGPYDDIFVDDEFYWAATELYLATGIRYFAEEMRQSPLHLTVPVEELSLMSWQRTEALGIISLATVGDRRYFAKYKWVKKARNAIVGAADKYVDAVAAEAYGIPFSSDSYPWGSNSAVVNNMIVLALAHDFTCKDEYRDAVVESANYIFGVNPMGHSYVTGYGTRAEQFPHHRFWANVLNPAFPSPPPGVMSGGPNSGLQDPVAQALLQGCAPQRCFVDNIDAWSVNEITINWNAPFAWVTSYLDEYAQLSEMGEEPRSCRYRGKKPRRK